MGMFSEVLKLQILFTIPVATATAVKSFSAIRQLKMCLRSTMTQRRYNNVILLHCHKERSDCIDLIKITSANDHRISFFGTYQIQ